MSAIIQPRLFNREVVRCECGLIQFKSASGNCVKLSCRKPYAEPEEPIAVEPVPFVPARSVAETVPAMLRILRLALGMSQREVGIILGIPRTYVSKMETRNKVPHLRGFLRFCNVMGISPQAFIYLCEHAS